MSVVPLNPPHPHLPFLPIRPLYCRRCTCRYVLCGDKKVPIASRESVVVDMRAPVATVVCDLFASAASPPPPPPSPPLASPHPLRQNGAPHVSGAGLRQASAARTPPPQPPDPRTIITLTAGTGDEREHPRDLGRTSCTHSAHAKGGLRTSVVKGGVQPRVFVEHGATTKTRCQDSHKTFMVEVFTVFRCRC